MGKRKFFCVSGGGRLYQADKGLAGFPASDEKAGCPKGPAALPPTQRDAHRGTGPPARQSPPSQTVRQRAGEKSRHQPSGTFFYFGYADYAYFFKVFKVVSVSIPTITPLPRQKKLGGSFFNDPPSAMMEHRQQAFPGRDQIGRVLFF